ncbi:MAG: ABC transporter substrate-binding protein, partial [Pseudomonadota bacterium]
QNAILSAGGEKLAAKLGTIAQREREFGIGKFREGGAAITEASPEMIAEVKERLAYIEQDWLKDAEEAGIDGPAALAYYRDIVTQMEGQ